MSRSISSGSSDAMTGSSDRDLGDTTNDCLFMLVLPNGNSSGAHFFFWELSRYQDSGRHFFPIARYCQLQLTYEH
jgi:hypothetical protein